MEIQKDQFCFSMSWFYPGHYHFESKLYWNGEDIVRVDEQTILRCEVQQNEPEPKTNDDFKTGALVGTAATIAVLFLVYVVSRIK